MNLRVLFILSTPKLNILPDLSTYINAVTTHSKYVTNT